MKCFSFRLKASTVRYSATDTCPPLRPSPLDHSAIAKNSKLVLSMARDIPPIHTWNESWTAVCRHFRCTDFLPTFNVIFTTLL